MATIFLKNVSEGMFLKNAKDLLEHNSKVFIDDVKKINGLQWFEAILRFERDMS